MAIKDESQGDLSLNNDIRPEIGIDVSQQNVSLGNNNTELFAAVVDGDTTTGRSMSEMGGESLAAAFFPQTIADGAIGKSITFNGSNERIQRTMNGGNRKINTISMWFKFTDEDNSSVVEFFSWGDGSGSDRFYCGVTKNTGLFFISEFNGSVYRFQRESRQGLMEPNNWYHLVISADTTKDIPFERGNIYINGQLIKEWQTTTDFPENHNSDLGRSGVLSIGWDQNLGSRYSDFILGDFKYCEGRAFTAYDFGEYKNEIWVPKKFNLNENSDTIVTSDLLINLDANDKESFNGGTTWSDLTSNNNDGSINSSNVKFIDNNQFRYFDFSGTAYIDLNHSLAINLNTTYEFWIRTTSTTPGRMLGNSTTVGSGTTFTHNFEVDANGNVALQTQDNWYTAGSSTGAEEKTANLNLNDGLWNHIVVRKTNGIFQIFKNGTQIDPDDSFTTRQQTSTFVAEAGIVLMSQRRTYGYYPGQLAEFRMYDAALTNDEISNNYNATKDRYKYGHYGFWLQLSNQSEGSYVNDSSLKQYLDASNASSYSGSGTSWLDLSGNGNNASLGSSITYSSNEGGKFGFNSSSNAIINLGSVSGVTDSITMEGWWKVNPFSGSTTYQSLATYQDDRYVYMFMTGDGAVRVNYEYSNTSSNLYSTTTGYDDGNWHHIAHVVTPRWHALYVDGKLENEATNVLHTSINSQNGYSLIGGYDSNASDGLSPAYLLSGAVAKYRVYNRALTAKEVQQNYLVDIATYKPLNIADFGGRQLFTSYNMDATNTTSDEPNKSYAQISTIAPNSNYFAESEGNLRFTRSGSGYYSSVTNMPVNSGKWYCEYEFISSSYYPSARSGPGLLADKDWHNSYLGTTSDSWAWGSNGAIYHDNLNIASSSVTATTGDIIGFALDLDNHRWFISKNGSWLYSHDPATPSTGIDISGFRDYYIAFWGYTTTDSGQFNFGAKSFDYTAPSGYNAMSTDNIPDLTIDPGAASPDKPTNYFDTAVYNGNDNNATDAFTYSGWDFKPDFLIVKNIDTSGENWASVDSVRGGGKILYPNLLLPQSSSSYFTLVDNGFKVSTNNNNLSNYDYVAYGWKAAGDANTYNILENGSVTTSATAAGVSLSSGTTRLSGLSANRDAGFSIIKYSGNGYPSSGSATNQVAHGLSKAPEMVIIKKMDSNNPGNGAWVVGTEHLGNGWDGGFYLTSSGKYSTTINYFWNNPATSTIIDLKSDWYVNGSGSNYICYAWHSVEGFSRIGRYFGNGSSDGPFVNTGFKPAFVMVKRATGTTSSTDYWLIFDNARSDEYPNMSRITTADSQYTGQRVLFYSNGFKLKDTDSSRNISGTTYFYMAFAESPYKYNNAVGNSTRQQRFNMRVSKEPNKYFKAKTFIGTGEQKLINLGFRPDLMIKKTRDSSSFGFMWYDSLRPGYELNSNSGGSGQYAGNSAQAFENGATSAYDLGINNQSGRFNNNNEGYITYNWKAGGQPTATNSNNSGAMTANSVSLNGVLQSSYTPSGSPSKYPNKMSINTEAGFSIITYEGNSTAGTTIPHGLSKAPQFTIIKNIDGVDDWFTWHHYFPESGGEYQWLRLNSGSTTPTTFNAQAVWNDVAPTNEILTLNGGGSPNESGNTHVLYAWHEVPGFSKIGKYKGTGAANTVYTGFEPAIVIIRRIDSNNSWAVFDNAKDTDATKNHVVWLDLTDQEADGGSTTALSFDTNGFSMGSSAFGSSINTSNGEYVYIAFAHN